MTTIPAELQISGVYLPPLLVASTLGVCAAAITAKLLNRLRWSRYFFFPPVVFVAMVVIYTALIGQMVAPF